MDDDKIIELYLSRDESAIRETQEKYGSRLRQTAYRILENHGAAEECENDTYLEAWNCIPPHEPRGYFFEFLLRIIKHAAIDACRRNNRLKRKADFCELTKEMEECLPGEGGMDRRRSWARSSPISCEAIRKSNAAFSCAATGITTPCLRSAAVSAARRARSRASFSGCGKR